MLARAGRFPRRASPWPNRQRLASAFVSALRHGGHGDRLGDGHRLRLFRRDRLLGARLGTFRAHRIARRNHVALLLHDRRRLSPRARHRRRHHHHPREPEAPEKPPRTEDRGGPGRFAPVAPSDGTNMAQPCAVACGRSFRTRSSSSSHRGPVGASGSACRSWRPCVRAFGDLRPVMPSSSERMNRLAVVGAQRGQVAVQRVDQLVVAGVAGRAGPGVRDGTNALRPSPPGPPDVARHAPGNPVQPRLVDVPA